jgi:hypothetical protein
MNLNDAQKQQVTAWITDGLKLSDIQKRLETDFGVRATYMEVRFLLDDLKLMPKDPVPPPPPPTPVTPPALVTTPGTNNVPAEAKQEPLAGDVPPPPGSGGVQVGVDQIAKPGAALSGTVTFSDGQSGMWYLDEAGRLGLGMKQKGYRPPAADVEEFQIKLQQELAKMGF